MNNQLFVKHLEVDQTKISIKDKGEEKNPTD